MSEHRIEFPDFSFLKKSHTLFKKLYRKISEKIKFFQNWKNQRYRQIDFMTFLYLALIRIVFLFMTKVDAQRRKGTMRKSDR